jgi:hypothetical protein
MAINSMTKSGPHHRPSESAVVLMSDYQVGQRGRIALALMCLFLIAGFATAVNLNPSPLGMGTHQSLGLPPCSFVTIFGVRCPTCGMTTSFSHFVRGQWMSAAQANIAGLTLACLCSVMIPWGIASLCVGRLWRIEDPHRAALWLVGSVTGLSLLQWAVRMLLAGFGQVS